MYQHYIGSFDASEQIAHPLQHPAGDIGKILPLFHYIQVVVGDYIEDAQNLVEHLAVLTGNRHNCAELFVAPLQFLHKRSHLYSLGTCAEHQHYRFHIVSF